MKFPSRFLTTALACLLLASCGRTAPEPDYSGYAWPSSDDAKIVLSDMIEWPKLRRNMSLLKRFVGFEYDVEPIYRPYAVDANDAFIAVTDIQYGMLYLIDADTWTLDVIRTFDGRRLHSPVDVAFAGSDLYVVDSGLAAIYVVDTENGDVRLFDVPADRPTSISVDAGRGRAFITDTGRNVVMITDLAGNVVGELKDTFNFPIDSAIDEAAGEVFVLDSMNFRVSVFDFDGTKKRQFGKVGTGPGSFFKPKSIALDGFGRVYVDDAEFDNFQIFDTEGRLLYFIGASGSDPAQFYMPARMAFHGGRLYVSDIYNSRVKVFAVNR